MNVRAHPTVRPYALALGVLPHRGLEGKLSFLGPSLAFDVATALVLDTLGALSTFPVRHRVVFSDGEDAVMRQIKLPATWREHSLRGRTQGDRVANALSDLAALGAEAMMLVSADGPMLPLGQLFDGMMWLLPKNRVVLGPRTSGEGGREAGLYAIGSAEPLPYLGAIDGALGLDGHVDDELLPDVVGRVRAQAERAGTELMTMPPSYQVDSREAFARFKLEVAGGLFAPHCRKLLERPEIANLG